MNETIWKMVCDAANMAESAGHSDADLISALAGVIQTAGWPYDLQASALQRLADAAAEKADNARRLAAMVRV